MPLAVQIKGYPFNDRTAAVGVNYSHQFERALYSSGGGSSLSCQSVGRQHQVTNESRHTRSLSLENIRR